MGLIALPQRLSSQPQYSPSIAPEFRAYNPRIVALPVSNTNLVTSQPPAYVNGATRLGGNFHFPGVVGNTDYIDLGSEVVFDPGKTCTIVTVTRLTSFTSQFPIICGLKSSDGANLVVFYTTYGGLSDITIGSGLLGGQGYLLGGSVIGTWHNLVFTYDGSGTLGGFTAFCNGVALATNSSAGISSASGNSVLGMYSPADTSIPFSGDVQVLEYFSGKFPYSKAIEVSANPWITLQANPRRIFIAAGSGPTTYNQSVSGSLTPAGALTKQTRKVFAGSCTYAGALVKKTAKSYTGSLTPSGNLNKLTAHSFAGSITASGTLATMILFTASIAGSITASGVLKKMTLKGLAGASTFTGAITKMTSKGLSASITMSGLLNKLTKKSYSGAITVTGSLAESYQVMKSLAGSIKPTGAVAGLYIAFVAGVLKLLALMGVGQ